MDFFTNRWPVGTGPDGERNIASEMTGSICATLSRFQDESTPLCTYPGGMHCVHLDGVNDIDPECCHCGLGVSENGKFFMPCDQEGMMCYVESTGECAYNDVRFTEFIVPCKGPITF